MSTQKPLIATEYDDMLPPVPDGYSWLVVRESDDGHPTIYIALLKDHEPTGHRGRIDVELYGEGQAVIELAQDIARRLDRGAS